MARPPMPYPTPAEQRVLNFIHKRGSATIKEYFQAGGHRANYAYTSCMSTFGNLLEKGLVTRAPEGRANRYKPTISQAELRESVMAHVLETVFEGDDNALKSVALAAKPGKRRRSLQGA
jgi:predicted transcriptional regulator